LLPHIPHILTEWFERASTNSQFIEHLKEYPILKNTRLVKVKRIIDEFIVCSIIWFVISAYQ